MQDGSLLPDQAERLRRLVNAPRITPEAPSTGTGLGSGVGMAAEKPRATRLARAIAVSSGKGGVGKTNLSVNLAVAFAARGMRTALLDADLGLANADVLCGITPRITLEDVITGDRLIEEVMVHAPGGFRLVPGASGVSRLADIGAAQRRHVIEQLLRLEQSVDVLVIDTGAGIGVNSMAFAAASDTVLVTATPEPTSIADAYGAIKTLAARGAREGLQLVVNMAQSDEEARAVHARIDRVARAFLDLRIGYAGAIPLDQAVPKAVRRREPFVLAAPDAPAARAVRQLARSLAGESVGPSKADVRTGFLARLAGYLSGRPRA